MRPVHTAVHMQDSVWHTVTDGLACSDALQDILQSASCDTLYFASCLLLARCRTEAVRSSARLNTKLLKRKNSSQMSLSLYWPGQLSLLADRCRKAAHSVGWANSAYVFFCAHGSHRYTSQRCRETRGEIQSPVKCLDKEVGTYAVPKDSDTSNSLPAHHSVPNVSHSCVQAMTRKSWG